MTALTPDAVLYWGENGGERKLTLAQAREKCGFAASSALDFSDVADSEYAQEIDSLAAGGAASSLAMAASSAPTRR